MAAVQQEEPRLMGLDQSFLASFKAGAQNNLLDESSGNHSSSLKKPPEKISMLQRAMADPKKIFPNRPGTSFDMPIPKKDSIKKCYSTLRQPLDG